MHAEFVKAKAVEPNHKRKRQNPSRVKGAVKRAGIASLRSNDFHEKRGEASPDETVGNQVENRADKIDGGAIRGEKDENSKSVGQAGARVSQTTIPIAGDEYATERT